MRNLKIEKGMKKDSNEELGKFLKEMPPLKEDSATAIIWADGSKAKDEYWDKYIDEWLNYFSKKVGIIINLDDDIREKVKAELREALDICLDTQNYELYFAKREWIIRQGYKEALARQSPKILNT